MRREGNLPALSENPPRSFTWRSLFVGLVVGTVLCCTNMYFGLQTGWVTMGSLQSALLGFGLFQILRSQGLGLGFDAAENVIVQTTAVATATMPLAAGFVGIIPAFSQLTPEENPPSGGFELSAPQLAAWSCALAFFGVFFAVPLRKQVIQREKLPFPSGTATAEVIAILHGKRLTDRGEDADGSSEDETDRRRGAPAGEGGGVQRAVCASPFAEREHCPELPPRAEAPLSLRPKRSCSGDALCHHHTIVPLLTQEHSGLPQEALDKLDSDRAQWGRTWAVLLWSMLGTMAASVVTFLVPGLGRFPVFDWAGLRGASAWGWELIPAFGYVGQGMIMGPRTTASMLCGAIVGYAVLGPHARREGWAPGPIQDWETGASGWVLWVSLAVMLGDSLTSLALLAASYAGSALADAWRGALRRAEGYVRGPRRQRPPSRCLWPSSPSEPSGRRTSTPSAASGSCRRSFSGPSFRATWWPTSSRAPWRRRALSRRVT
uniref:Opt superfamily oligopeptide transporter n=1 Tax=Tetraselmis sp. GSL018 TaxID=582737 RepID=A0A061R958_9CHLO